MESKVDLSGIVRNTSSLNSPMGSCQEIIGLRKKYGTWRPILPKTAIKTNFTASNEMFIHSMDEYEYFINYGTDGTIKALTDQNVFVELLTTLGTGLDIKFNAIGNFLLINDRTNYVRYIFRCEPAEATKYIDVSNIPIINMAITSVDTEIFQQYVSKHNNESFQSAWWLLDDGVRDFYAGYFEGFVFLRWAIELIDGTTLKHSAPVFMYNGEISATDAPTEVTIRTDLWRLQYTLPAALPADWANYENLIRGISVFMTKPISKYDLDKSGLTEEEVFIGLVEKENLLIDIFRNESLYYRVHHIPYNKIIVNDTGWIGWSKAIGNAGAARDGSVPLPRTGPFSRPGGTQRRESYSTMTRAPGVNVLRDPSTYNPAELNINDITSYDVLNVDDISHHDIVGIRTLNYNNRLFYGDIYTTLFDGYNIENLITKHNPVGGDITVFDLYIEVDLATDQGMRTVRQETTSVKEAISFPYLIGYPDIRATELRILHNSGGSTVYKLTISLESHPVMNMATANKIDGVDIDVMAKDTNGVYSIAIADIDTVGALATLNVSIRDKNRVQLTELHNPFVTPAINSYQVGEGNILRLAVNMLPLEDQFGTFPVFVFSSRGIWALNLSDTGSIVISNIVPVSSSVCTNSDSVIVVDNLLVFLASDGIKLLTGQTPAEISDIAEGSPTSLLTGNSTYGEVMVQALMNDVEDQISSVDILTYALTAKFGYDKNHREIIVSNTTYKYSYIYSLDEKVWYKCFQVFKKFINNYPNLYAFLSTGNDLVDISQEAASGDVAIYFETRPILIGPDKEVKLTRVILGSLLNVATDKWVGFLLYGSNDGVTWSLITGKEIEGDSIYNIILPRIPISLRYVILVLSGTVDQNSVISEVRIVT